MNIVICGLPGTGKTTLSKRLSESLNLNYISDYDIINKFSIEDYLVKNKDIVLDVDYRNFNDILYVSNNKNIKVIYLI